MSVTTLAAALALQTTDLPSQLSHLCLQPAQRGKALNTEGPVARAL